MRVLIFVVVGVIGGLVLLAGIVALIGSRLPKTHVASRSILLHRSPQEVYAVVRDFGSAPQWRSDVKQMEVEAPQGGPVYFREVGKNGTVNYELVEDVPGHRMVTRIRDTDLGYSGQWTYLFTPENGGTRVTIREDGEVSNDLSFHVTLRLWTNSNDRFLPHLPGKALRRRTRATIDTYYAEGVIHCAFCDFT